MKYIDAEKLYKQVDSLMARYAEYEKEFEVDDEELSIFYQGKSKMCGELLSLIDSLQQEQPEEICSKCIHHGKDDGYCYNPHGGMQSLINENGVYECTGFCEQEQTEVDLGNKFGWHNISEETPEFGDTIIVACKNKNKEDGIWLYDLIHCWEGKWEPRENWEAPLKWISVDKLGLNARKEK